MLNSTGGSVTTLVGDETGDLALLQTLQTEPDPISIYLADAHPNLDFGTFDRSGSLEFHDSDRTKVKVKLSGSGEGRVTQDNFGRTMIRLTDTGPRTRLTITDGAGGNRMADIHDIVVVGGSMKTITGKSTNFSGLLNVSDGSISKVEFRNVDTRCTWLIGADDPRDQLQFRLTNVKDTSVDSKIPIKNIAVREWVDQNSLQEPDTITAPWVKTVKATLAFGAGFDLIGINAPQGNALKSVKAGDGLPTGVYRVASGDIGSIRGDEVAQGFVIDDPHSHLGKFNISGDATFDIEVRLAGNIDVKGTVRESTLVLNQPVDSRRNALKKLKVKGKMEKFVLTSAGHVGTIDAQIMEEVFIYLAVGERDPGVTFPPSIPNPFDANAELKKVKTKKLRNEEASFIKSVIAAARIRSAKLEYIQFDNNNIAFSMLTDSIRSLTFREAEVRNRGFRMTNVETANDAKGQVETDELNDFEIRVL